MAWKSFTVGERTWTLGLSTPENEIFEYYGIRANKFLTIGMCTVITALCFACAALVLRWYRRSRDLAADLNTANARLMELDSAKSDFIAGISQELRSPLCIVSGLAELNAAKDDLSASDCRRDFSSIYAASSRMNGVLTNLLGVARLRSTAISLRYTRLDLPFFVASLVDYHRALLARDGVEVRSSFPPDGIANLWTDRPRLEEILDNLLSRAAGSVIPGEGVIELSVVSDGGFALFTVSDNGKGMDADKLEGIFDLYRKRTQADSVGEDLGLYYARLLAVRARRHARGAFRWPLSRLVLRPDASLSASRASPRATSWWRQERSTGLPRSSTTIRHPRASRRSP